ncbi:MAG: hypothetical protein ABI127_06955 [Dokdonella sp.]
MKSVNKPMSWNPVANATRYEYKVLSNSANASSPTESTLVSLTPTSIEGGGNSADSQYGGWFERTYSIRRKGDVGNIRLNGAFFLHQHTTIPR